MATEAVENYLKAIYTLCRESPTGEAGMTRIASAVGVTTGTATSMIKKLARARLARYERFGGVSLAPKGTRVALDIIRRHRIVETFLVRTLKLDWSIVNEEAERLEHAISSRVLEALDRHLGHPEFDPHGDPIPGSNGRIAERSLQPLADCAAGERVTLAQVLDQRVGRHADDRERARRTHRAWRTGRAKAAGGNAPRPCPAPRSRAMSRDAESPADRPARFARNTAAPKIARVSVQPSGRRDDSWVSARA
jgi:DtxR family Mn-dependent transcriptional regulator